MRAIALRVLVAVGLLVAGWSVGKAQTAVADFELTVDAPGGKVSIDCRRGCDFTHDVGRIDALPRPNTTFTFQCGAARCSATINGHGHVLR